VEDAALVALDDLEDEHAALDAIVAGLDARAWDAPTPAEGWAVRDQVFTSRSVRNWPRRR
jgi:hypothetical protein